MSEILFCWYMCWKCGAGKHSECENPHCHNECKDPHCIESIHLEEGK